MADSVQRRGRDTFVNGATAKTKDQSYEKTPNLRVSNGSAKIYVHLPLPGVRKRTIESATLSVPVKGSWAAQTLTATPVDEDWAPRKTTWNNQPALRTAQAVSQAQAAKSDGERVEIDVTAYVQNVADGAKHFGWCITTSSSAMNKVYGFDAPGNDSWRLTVDFVEAPEAPTDLAPNGSVVGVEPVLTFDFTDLGGDSTELAAVNVRVNTSAGTSGAWDSGEIAATTPQFDLAAAAWSTIPASGTTYFWQVRVKDGAGYWSDWSDWASFTYAPKPTLTVDNPAGGLVWDPTPTIAAHISTGVIKAWRILVAKGNDKTRVLYDSGKNPGNGTSSLAHTLPLRNDERRRILKDDATYWLNVRVWDRNDREATPGDPTYTSTWVQFLMDDDATPPPPDFCMAVQVGDTPRVRLTWQRVGGYAEGWVIRRDGEVLARLDTDEVDAAGDDQFSWVDNAAEPFVPHTYTVKVIDGSKQSVASPEAWISTEVAGVWLLTDDAQVSIDGKQVSSFRRTDRRATYQPLNSPYDVDIVHALGTMTAPFTGTISSLGGRDAIADRKVIEDLGEQPERVVQLVYGTRSVPVKLRNVSVDPHDEFQKHNMRHYVSFEAYLAGE